MKDTEIVELYWRCSDQAIRETEMKYGAYCRTVAYNILENREDTEECVSDTWFSAWNAMPDKRPDKLAPFLGRITRNAAITRALERTRLKRGGGELPLALDELDECIASGYSLEAETERRELEAALARFVRALPETERKIFVARYWFLAPIAELAEKFSFSQSKVTSMLHRTRKKLQRYLTEEGLCEIPNN